MYVLAPFLKAMSPASELFLIALISFMNSFGGSASANGSFSSLFERLDVMTFIFLFFMCFGTGISLLPFN